MTRQSARLAILAVLAETRTERYRPCKTHDTTDRVDHGRTCEVMEAHRGQPAAAPYPVAIHRIDEGRDDERVDQVRLELETLGHRSGHDRGGRGSKDHLEHEVAIHGDVVSVTAERELTPADEARLVRTVHECPPDREVGERPHGHVEQILHHQVVRVLGPAEAGFHHREPCLHEEDQEAGHQHPDERRRRCRICCKSRGSCGITGGERRPGDREQHDREQADTRDATTHCVTPPPSRVLDAGRASWTCRFTVGGACFGSVART